MLTWHLTWKFECFTNYIDYIGPVICPNRLQVLAWAASISHKRKPPAIVIELQSLLGLYSPFHTIISWQISACRPAK